MTGGVEHLQVAHSAMIPPRGLGEDPPARPVAEQLQVIAQQRHQLGVNRHDPGLASRPVLELSPFAGPAAVSPPGSAARLGVGQA
jgi:hypothetical protein